MAACATIKRSDSVDSVVSVGSCGAVASTEMKRSSSFERLNEMKRTPSLGKISSFKRIGSREKLAPPRQPASPSKGGGAHRQTLSRSSPAARRSWAKLDGLTGPATYTGDNLGVGPTFGASADLAATSTSSSMGQPAPFHPAQTCSAPAAQPAAAFSGPRPLTRSASREMLNKQACMEASDLIVASHDLFTTITPGVPEPCPQQGRPLTRSASRDMLSKSGNDLSMMSRTDSWTALMSPAMPRCESFSKVFGSCTDLVSLNSVGSCGDLEIMEAGDVKCEDPNTGTDTKRAGGISHDAMIGQAIAAATAGGEQWQPAMINGQPAQILQGAVPMAGQHPKYFTRAPSKEQLASNPGLFANGGPAMNMRGQQKALLQQRGAGGGADDRVEVHIRQSPMMNPQARYQTPLEMALGGAQQGKPTSASQEQMRDRQHQVAQDRLRTLQYASSLNLEQGCVALPLSAIVGYNRDSANPGQGSGVPIIHPQYLPYYTLVPKNSPAYQQAVQQGLVVNQGQQQQQSLRPQQQVPPEHAQQQQGGPFENFPPEIAQQMQYHQQQQIMLAALASQQRHGQVMSSTNAAPPQHTQTASISPGQTPQQVEAVANPGRTPKRRRVRHFDQDGFQWGNNQGMGDTSSADHGVETVGYGAASDSGRCSTAAAASSRSGGSGGSSSSKAGKTPVLQCLGVNRKRKTRCRNAALMEYVGPRPLYCAEHIESDPQAQYHKCGYVLSAPDHRGKEKRCKEIVYKDFRRCYKHLDEWLHEDFTGEGALERTSAALSTSRRLALQLEQEAASAKGEDQELYQRKSKILPKYQSMLKTMEGHYIKLGGSITATDPADTVPLHPAEDHVVTGGADGVPVAGPEDVEDVNSESQAADALDTGLVTETEWGQAAEEVQLE